MKKYCNQNPTAGITEWLSGLVKCPWHRRGQ